MACLFMLFCRRFWYSLSSSSTDVTQISFSQLYDYQYEGFVFFLSFLLMTILLNWDTEAPSKWCMIMVYGYELYDSCYSFLLTFAFGLKVECFVFRFPLLGFHCWEAPSTWLHRLVFVRLVSLINSMNFECWLIIFLTVTM